MTDDYEERTILQVEQHLDNVRYLNAVDIQNGLDPYVPSDFALELVNFIKLINGESGEENKSPVMHFKMLDNISSKSKRIISMAHRGSSKTTLIEYLFLYLAVYQDLPNLGAVNVAMYISDSIDNGVKNMRKNLEHRWNSSEFLQHYIPKIKFTDVRWEFFNINGSAFVIRGFGGKSGVRGFKEYGSRPVFCAMDDLISDEDARSPTVISTIEDTVGRAVNFALHPERWKIVWAGTPFNSRDPLYKAIGSGAWKVSAFPICESFPCSEDEFRGSWEDRFSYDYVRDQYDAKVLQGKISDFNQELMLRIMSEEDRLIKDEDFVWYKRSNVLTNKTSFNFYITTDFATTEASSGDFSVISVWAYNNNGDWLWVDGVCKKQLMDKNLDDLFRLVQEYNPRSVGVEISAQQKGFIPWIQQQMTDRNCYFNLASNKNSNQLGLSPTTKKVDRFLVVVPLFKAHKIWFPEEMRNTPPMREAIDELSLVSRAGFKSKHDDFSDTISQIADMQAWRPNKNTPKPAAKDKDWDDWGGPGLDDADDVMGSYVV